MNKAEEILRTYVDFEDVNGSEPITLLPLTVIDAMEEYATQYQEDMAKELEKETLDELFDAHEPEDFIDENEQNWWEKNKQD